MFNDYDPSQSEEKWQKRWAKAKLFDIDLKKTKADDKFYNLVMFPYPSGDKLHVGHWYNFSPADSFARFMRMKGKTVLEPMGFDAFGLPAENYAIKTGIPPFESTGKNVKTMIKQLTRIGTMYDWSKTVNTSEPAYYRWTQWLFLQMYQHKLAYKKQAPVNWCPSCQTVLANEQVKDGKCERCGTEVMQKNLTQWFWKITDYAEKLLHNLDGLDWPEKTKLMQRNWIGRSEGAEISFSIKNQQSAITVFTTRPDTLFGATYLVLAPEHPLVETITPKDHWGAVHEYREDVKKKTELQRTDLAKTKTGKPTGAFALHPVTGKELPIWIADYVLMTYGTGAIMAVPAHDERDFDFASFYGLPIKCIINPDLNTINFSSFVHPPFAEVVSAGRSSDKTQKEKNQEYLDDVLSGRKCWKAGGKMIDSGFLTELTSDEAKKKMIAWLEDEEKGRGVIQYRLRDWLISRQRYWGAPIPIVYDPEGNPHPVPEEHLPWLLPTDVEFKPTGKSPLTESKEFRERTEKIFGEGWTPEFDTMDTFVCSSFYYLRYLAQGDSKRLIDPRIERTWMPVDMYIGGPEHATMHLIYARFVMMALKDFGFVSHEEPFQRLVHQGLITNQGAKMSKSKGNVVSPDSFIERHGSDVFRMYLMFMGPFTDGGDWSDTGIKGISRFVQRVWKTLTEKTKANIQEDAELQTKLHKTIQTVTNGLERLLFNTSIASLMELLNAMEKREAISKEMAQTFTLLLSPLAPHLAEELWESLGCRGFVVEQQWPIFDPALLKAKTLTIMVQVNGKIRGQLEVDAEASKEDILAAAKQNENVKKYLTGPVKKEIYVPGKLVSLVL